MQAVQRLLRPSQKYEKISATELVPLEEGELQHAVLSIKGMTCSACTSAVEQVLSALPGVVRVQVALLQESAEVKYDPSLVSPAKLAAAVEDAGFDAAVKELPGSSLAAAAGGRCQPQVTRLQIWGMTCAACTGSVESTLNALPGVTSVGVSLTSGEAEIVHDPSLTSAEALAGAVEDAGFDAKVLTKAGLECCTLDVQGMTCGACSSAVEKVLHGVTGVSSASVSLMTNQAQVWYQPGVTGPRDFVTAIQDAGFEAGVTTSAATQDNHGEELAKWRRLLLLSSVFTVPVFLLAMVFPMVPALSGPLKMSVGGFPLNELLKWILASPVQFWVGWRFHKGAYKALKRGTANMDVLVSLGTNASYIYSVISILHHHFAMHHLYEVYVPTDFFETSAMLITVVLLGKFLECAAKGRTSDAIKCLLALAPDTALLVTLDEAGNVLQQQEVHSSLIHQGDVLKVLPGGRVPADGELLEGSTYINEAMITGEAHPVFKNPGDPLVGGTINEGNAVLMCATRVGSDTVLSQIVRLVERAQMTKAPIQAYADYISSIFVPVVVSLAVMTWAAWFIAGSVQAYPEEWLPQGHTHFLFALLFGIAVLVIACPCALGLATPTAVMVGTGVGASLGILIKGGDALERGHRIDTVVFDKTGTLTLGRPTVVEHRIFSADYSLQQVSELAAAAEASSEHPLARAVLEWAERFTDPSSTTTAAAAAAAASHAGKQQGLGALNSTTLNGSTLNGTTLNGSTQLSNGNGARWQLEQAAGDGAGGGGWGFGSSGASSSSSSALGLRTPEKGLEQGSPNSRQRPPSPVTTPKVLSQLIRTGLFRVSDVVTHPGKGVTASIPCQQLLPGHLQRSPASSDRFRSTPNLTTLAAANGSGGSPSYGLHSHNSSSPISRLKQQRGARHGPLFSSSVPELVASPGNGHQRTGSSSSVGSPPTTPGSFSLDLVIGNRLLLSEQRCSVGPEVESWMTQHEDAGRTCVLMAVSKRVVAALAIADPLKPEAAGVVAALYKQGLQCHMLTGDNWRTARTVAQQLGLPEGAVTAEVLPGDKAECVMKLQAQGRAVAVVGDGINDSPALAAADVGMAIATGTDIAMEAADYVLMRDSLEQVLVALELSRRTYSRIKANFVWAMGYNVVMIPIAAGVLYPFFHVQLPPWVAGGCMVFSSLSVVLSSLGLRWYQPPPPVLQQVVVS